MRIVCERNSISNSLFSGFPERINDFRRHGGLAHL